MVLQANSFFPSSFSFSSSSFSPSWTYDVFLSFRGSDTRYGFTGNLYKSLSDKGIHTFIDDEELRRGDEITPSLIKAIKESRIAIVVFSKNYASSSFCLEEFATIMDCVHGNGRLVYPIFYEVDPSDVRHQKASYGEAMAKYQERFKDEMPKLHKWRHTLRQAANLSGKHVKIGNDYEHVYIENITQEVYNKIHHTPLYIKDVLFFLFLILFFLIFFLFLLLVFFLFLFLFFLFFFLVFSLFFILLLLSFLFFFLFLLFFLLLLFLPPLLRPLFTFYFSFRPLFLRLLLPRIPPPLQTPSSSYIFFFKHLHLLLQTPLSSSSNTFTLFLVLLQTPSSSSNTFTFFLLLLPSSSSNTFTFTFFLFLPPPPSFSSSHTFFRDGGKQFISLHVLYHY